MRELKFRAWLDEYKQYIYFGGEYKEPNGRWGKGRCALVGNNHIVDLFINEDNTRNWFQTHKVECIEQYTGIKDKNNKEIYEGDIVGDYYDDEEVGHIVFDDGSFCVNWAISPENLDGDLADILIVIGNIHENPELVGEE